MDAVESTSEAVSLWRGWLIGAGVLLLLLGGAVFVSDVTLDQYPGLVLWLGGAVILHDGVGAMAVFAATVLLRRAGRVVPFVVLAVIQGALAVVAIVTVVVVPEIVKNAIGTANPTILPLDYGRNLLVFYVATGALTATAIVVALIARRRSSRTR